VDESSAGAPRDPALERAQARAMFVGAGAALVTLPLAYYAHHLAVDPYHTPLVAPDGRLFYLASLLAAAAVGWLASRQEAGARSSADWALPAVTVFAALWTAGAYHRWPVVLGAALLSGSGVFVALFVRYLRDEGPESSRAAAALGDQLLTNIVGYAAFSVILLHHSPVKYAALEVLAVGALLALWQLRGTSLRCLAYALIVGLTLAQATWAFSYWQSSGWALGAIAQAIWYGMAAACLANMRGELGRDTLVRHGGLAAGVCVIAAIIAT
jgi:hypothetical protein